MENVFVCQPQQSSKVTLQAGSDAIAVMRIEPDGKVWLNPELDLSQVKSLPLWLLHGLREVVNTAIYDAERKG